MTFADIAPGTPVHEAEEDARPVLLLAADLPQGQIWLGNRTAANDPSLLMAKGVTSTLNVAVNIPTLPLTLPDGTEVRRARIGLIDGPGNDPAHLLAAGYAIQGMLAQASPGKAHYPPHRRGGLLVHCRGGRSRSVTAVAVALELMGHGSGSLDQTVEVLRQRRGVGPAYPMPAMLHLGAAALALAGR